MAFAPKALKAATCTGFCWVRIFLPRISAIDAAPARASSGGGCRRNRATGSGSSAHGRRSASSSMSGAWSRSSPDARSRAPGRACRKAGTPCTKFAKAACEGTARSMVPSATPSIIGSSLPSWPFGKICRPSRPEVISRRRRSITFRPSSCTSPTALVWAARSVTVCAWAALAMKGVASSGRARRRSIMGAVSFTAGRGGSQSTTSGT